MTERAAVRRTIAELTASDMPPLLPLWPDVGQLLGLSESAAFEHAKSGRLPVELVRVGRRRYARTLEVLAWLGLPNGDGAGGPAPTPLAGTHHSNLSDQ